VDVQRNPHAYHGVNVLPISRSRLPSGSNDLRNVGFRQLCLRRSGRGR
jgi:hypothetical protein